MENYNESSATSTLQELREMHRVVAQRARKAWLLIRELHQVPVMLPAEATRNALADSAYCTADDEADWDELRSQVVEQLASAWPKQQAHQGAAHYVIRPFFTEYDRHASALGLGFLRGCDLSTLEALDVEVPSVSHARPQGLSAVEITALEEFYKSQILGMVNALRRLRTALYGVSSSLERAAQGTQCSVRPVISEQAGVMVRELIQVAELSLKPAPATAFGTHAEHVNPLRRFPPMQELSQAFNG